MDLYLCNQCRVKATKNNKCIQDEVRVRVSDGARREEKQQLGWGMLISKVSYISKGFSQSGKILNSDSKTSFHNDVYLQADRF